MKADSTVIMGSTFLVTDSEGRPTRDHDGFYYRDVRHLDDYALSVDEDLESLEVVDVRPGERLLHLGTPLETGSRKLHVSRRQFVADGLFEDLTISNLSGSPVKTSLTLRLGSRFDDLFEVRGMVADLDRTIDVDRHETGLTFRYAPSDAAFSRSVSITLAHVADIAIDVNSRANRVDATIEADLTLAPGESRTVPVAVTVDGPAPAAQQLQVARKTVRDRAEDWTEAKPIPEHSGSWTSVLRESHENLLELQLPTEHGPILAAGVPWFATAFGRDSIIAAFQSLGVDTGLAKGTCRYLGAHQADTYDAERDAEPGKILHEIRCGELTARELVPHRPYYGTVDATPLFVVLVHETWRRTGDDEFLAELWPNVQRALSGLTTMQNALMGDCWHTDSTVRGPVNCAIRAGKTAVTGLFTLTGATPAVPLPSRRSKATSTMRSGGAQNWPVRWGNGSSQRHSKRKPNALSSASTRPSGSQTRSSTR
ncbi:glycogen debranching N-terminal domain-containing protein [Halomicroarcula sp. GCM10025709]|uniref:amylo-alpha-1,6-glucosidase n=1 Tax=Halomicroarcula sp. GCM10025709 TaxID=3252669 RepID=UPI003610F30A